jgi:hypothetical protein
VWFRKVLPILHGSNEQQCRGFNARGPISAIRSSKMPGKARVLPLQSKNSLDQQAENVKEFVPPTALMVFIFAIFSFQAPFSFAVLNRDRVENLRPTSRSPIRSEATPQTITTIGTSAANRIELATIKAPMKQLLLPLLFIVSAVSAQTTTTTTTTTTVTTSPAEREVAVFIQPRASVPERLTVSESRLQIASYWNHNGSTMGLLMNGNQRILIYIRVRKDLEGVIEPGTVLFVGESENGRYTGKARRFSRGLPPIEYDVDGPILNGGNKVVLSGLAPIRNPNGSINNVIEDRLEFSYLQLAE